MNGVTSGYDLSQHHHIIGELLWSETSGQATTVMVAIVLINSCRQIS